VWRKDKQDLNGIVAALDAYKFKNNQGKSYGSGGFATSTSQELISSVRVITNWENESAFPDRILAVRPTQIEMRMSLQRAGFTFHVPKRPTIEPDDNPTLQIATVPAAAKEPIRKQLLNLGIDAASVYGDLDGLAARG
jgi:hypothetical protein